MSWYSTGDLSALRAVVPARVLAFDVETTGLNPRSDEVLQLAVVRGDGTVLVNERFRPERHASWPAAQRVNGIAPADLVNAPPLAEALPRVQRVFDTAELLVGYNITFDMGFLANAGVRLPGCLRFDVMREFALVAQARREGGGSWRTLAECAAYYGVSFRPHDALEDARATLTCFFRMLEDDGMGPGATRRRVVLRTQSGC